MFQIVKHLRKLDWLLLAAVILLISLSIVLIYSTSGSTAGEFDFSNLHKQVIFVALGLLFFTLASFFDYQLLKNYAYTLYIIMIVVLVGVLVFGTEIRGTRGWFTFGSFQVQPAEIAKVVLLIILARYFASITGKMSTFRYVVISGLITLIPAGLIILQPDFGSALVLIFLWLAMLLISGIKRIYVAMLGGGGFAIGWILWKFIFKDYQRERILTFLNPARDPLGAGYNIIQSKIAVGSGGWLGKGLGYGSQSQLKFLPAQQTDFIFAVLAEELGFLGASLLLVLFCFLLLRMMRAVRGARDDFGLMLGVGVIVIFLFQIIVNVGMNMGMVPVTGIPLPLVSYGGSSLISMLILVGILQSVAIRSKKLKF
ncbi:MAG: rod shape-determining protein RodA [Parcubacteria group bacterium]